MKRTINVILGVCAAILAYICVASIVDDQNLDADIDARKKVVIARLLDVKKAQEAFKEMHDTTVQYLDPESQEMASVNMGRYALSFDELEEFLKNGRYPEQIVKEGQIQEALQRKGWTEEKVAAKIYELRTQGMSNEQIRAALDAEELFGVWCDTIWSNNPVTAIYGRADYPIDSLRYIPFSDQYEEVVDGKVLNKLGEPRAWDFGERVEFKMGIPMHYVMECAAPFKSFLSGMGKLCDRKTVNMTQYEEGRGAFAGLKIGELAKDQWNNNAGNWE